MKDRQKHEVVEESEWMTVYKLESGETRHESKFLTQGLAVTSKSIKGRWNQFSQDERYDFVRAYQAKAEVTAEDEEILSFLMNSDDHVIWITIAPLLARHRDRDLVLTFLLSKIQQPKGPKANFYQALEALGDIRALPILREEYRKYGDTPGEPRFDTKLQYLDYLQCCRTLMILDGSREYLDTLKRFATSQDDIIRGWAETLLVV